MSSNIKATVINGGYSLLIETRHDSLCLSAQEAYDLYCALGAVLPKLVQPFKPYPREESK